MGSRAARVKRIVRLLLCVGWTMAAPGCTRWQYAYPWPAPGEAPARLGAARVTALDATTTMVLRDVEVTADSLIGWQRGRAAQRYRVALHRDEVLVVDRRNFDALRTAGASAIVIVVAYAGTALYFLSQVKV